MPINTTHHVLSAHAQNLAQYVSKGRQHAYVLMRAAVGGMAWLSYRAAMRTVCALYNSNYYPQ